MSSSETPSRSLSLPSVPASSAHRPPTPPPLPRHKDAGQPLAARASAAQRCQRHLLTSRPVPSAAPSVHRIHTALVPSSVKSVAEIKLPSVGSDCYVYCNMMLKCVMGADLCVVRGAWCVVCGARCIVCGARVAYCVLYVDLLPGPPPTRTLQDPSAV